MSFYDRLIVLFGHVCMVLAVVFGLCTIGHGSMVVARAMTSPNAGWFLVWGFSTAGLVYAHGLLREDIRQRKKRSL